MKRMYDDKIIKQYKGSIDDLLGGYSSDEASTKKIYCHPVVLVHSSYRIACLIFDNNPTAYTWTTFKEKVTSIATAISDTARVVMTGSFFQGGDLVVAQSMDVSTLGVMTLFGFKPSDGTTGTLDIQTVEPSYFFDGVNAIN